MLHPNTESPLRKMSQGMGLTEIQLTFHSPTHRATIYQEEKMLSLELHRRSAGCSTMTMCTRIHLCM